VIITFVDPSKYNYYIQVISWIILFCLSIYLIYKAVKEKRNIEQNKKSENKQSLVIAFLAWLAPCSFAWSIFLLLIALGKSQWVILLVFALWLGIFTTLCAVVITTVFLKNKIYHKIQFLAQYSTLFSASIIFIISFILLLKVI
jgi:ABC-type nickel/cobalt efflux system permease component RcnA